MLQSIIENAWNDRSLLQNQDTKTAILSVIEQLDKGKIRVAEPSETGWKVNDWVKKAVIMYFPIMTMKTFEVGPFEYYDKIPLKNNYEALGVRVVPNAVARHGAFLAKGVIMIPGLMVLILAPRLPQLTAAAFTRSELPLLDN